MAKLFWLVARFARVRILNSRSGGSREVLVSVSESSLPFYSILLTLSLFLCSYIVSIYFYLRIKCYKPTVFVALGLLSMGLLSAPLVIVLFHSSALLLKYWNAFCNQDLTHFLFPSTNMAFDPSTPLYSPSYLLHIIQPRASTYSVPHFANQVWRSILLRLLTW